MFLKNEFLKNLTSQKKDIKMTIKNRLQIAQTLLGKNIKPLVNKVIAKHTDLRKIRDTFIQFVYDYIQVLKIEDKDTDNHSYSKLTKTVFDSVNLNQTEHNNSYFKKFANVCVRGALLFHWQDNKKTDNQNNDIVINGLQFSKIDTVNWEIRKHQTVGSGNEKKVVRIQHSIDKGMLVAPFKLLTSEFIVKNKKEANTDSTLLTVDNTDINFLYGLFKDISARELNEQQAIDDSLSHPEMNKVILAIQVLSEQFKDMTLDKNFVASCFVDKRFLSAYDELEQQQLNLKKCNNQSVVDTGKGGKDDSWTNDKKKTRELERKVGSAQLNAIKKVDYTNK
jgi:hypothetical protein